MLKGFLGNVNCTQQTYILTLYKKNILLAGMLILLKSIILTTYDLQKE